MLHDLFLIADYFDDPAEKLQERALIKRYGPQAYYTAMESGFIERRALPCKDATSDAIICLTQLGLDTMMRSTGQCRV